MLVGLDSCPPYPSIVYLYLYSLYMLSLSLKIGVFDKKTNNMAAVLDTVPVKVTGQMNDKLLIRASARRVVLGSAGHLEYLQST